jgi:hypothetical protein
MALKNDWQNGDLFTPAAANDMANAVNGATNVTVEGTGVSNYDLDPTPLQASDVGAYTRAEVDDAIDTALTNSALVTTNEAQTLTAKTLTSPKVNEILDTNGNEIVTFTATAAAVNNYCINNNAAGLAPYLIVEGSDAAIDNNIYSKGTGAVSLRGGSDGARVIAAVPLASGAANFMTVTNSETGNPVLLGVAGTDTNISLNLTPKGSGTVSVTGDQVVTTNATQNLTSKTLTSPTLTTPALGTPSSGTLTNCTFPTLNQNTTGTASNVTGTVAVANGGTGATTLTGLVKGTGTTAMVAATAGTDYVAPGGALGTPSSGTLTNVTGLPLAGLVSGAYASAATASVLAQRDANANLVANAFVPGAAVVSASGALTLTASSAEVQIMTGTAQQTVTLPSSGVVAGQRFTIIHNGTGTNGTMAVSASGGANVGSIVSGNNQANVYIALQATPTTAAHWWQIAGSSLNARSFNAASSIAVRDSNANIQSSNFLPTTTSTATAAGTTTLTIASSQVQIFTGSTTQTVTLPTTSITAGMEYRIINQSSGSVTVQSSGANTVATVTANTLQLFIAQVSTPTTAAHWRAI